MQETDALPALSFSPAEAAQLVREALGVSVEDLAQCCAEETVVSRERREHSALKTLDFFLSSISPSVFPLPAFFLLESNLFSPEGSRNNLSRGIDSLSTILYPLQELALAVSTPEPPSPPQLHCKGAVTSSSPLRDEAFTSLEALFSSPSSSSSASSSASFPTSLCYGRDVVCHVMQCCMLDGRPLPPNHNRDADIAVRRLREVTPSLGRSAVAGALEESSSCSADSLRNLAREWGPLPVHCRIGNLDFVHGALARLLTAFDRVWGGEGGSYCVMNAVMRNNALSVVEKGGRSFPACVDAFSHQVVVQMEGTQCITVYGRRQEEEDDDDDDDALQDVKAKPKSEEGVSQKKNSPNHVRFVRLDEWDENELEIYDEAYLRRWPDPVVLVKNFAAGGGHAEDEDDDEDEDEDEQRENDDNAKGEGKSVQDNDTEMVFGGYIFAEEENDDAKYDCKEVKEEEKDEKTQCHHSSPLLHETEHVLASADDDLSSLSVRSRFILRRGDVAVIPMRCAVQFTALSADGRPVSSACPSPTNEGNKVNNDCTGKESGHVSKREDDDEVLSIDLTIGLRPWMRWSEALEGALESAQMGKWWKEIMQ